jgi:hypothetical protein
MTKHRKQVELPGLPGVPTERYLRNFCRLYLAYPDLLRYDTAFVRTLMEWFVTNVAPRRLTNQELAGLVDHFAVFSCCNSTTEARELVAQIEKRTVESVTRAHQRYGTSPEELAARREANQGNLRKLEAELRAELQAMGGNKTEYNDDGYAKIQCRCGQT